MTTKELNDKVLSLAPEWMVNDYNDLVHNATLEEWDDIPESLLEWIQFVDDQDWTDTNQFRNAVKKIDKALGVLVQVKEGEDVHTMNGRMRAGQWRYAKSYDELID